MVYVDYIVIVILISKLVSVIYYLFCHTPTRPMVNGLCRLYINSNINEQAS